MVTGPEIMFSCNPCLVILVDQNSKLCPRTLLAYHFVEIKTKSLGNMSDSLENETVQLNVKVYHYFVRCPGFRLPPVQQISDSFFPKKICDSI